MPCYSQDNVPDGYIAKSPDGPTYESEEDCLNACAEGACCETDGTCNIKPQCECDTDNGAVFAGVGEGCERCCGCSRNLRFGRAILNDAGGAAETWKNAFRVSSSSLGFDTDQTGPSQAPATSFNGILWSYPTVVTQFFTGTNFLGIHFNSRPNSQQTYIAQLEITCGSIGQRLNLIIANAVGNSQPVIPIRAERGGVELSPKFPGPSGEQISYRFDIREEDDYAEPGVYDYIFSDGTLIQIEIRDGFSLRCPHNPLP